MCLKRIALTALFTGLIFVLAAAKSEDEAAEEPVVPFGAPVFPEEMYVPLWDESSPVYYEHSDTIWETEYGRCVNYNRLEFSPEGEDGVLMVWDASAEFENGFTASCVYEYRGRRDLNVVMFTGRHPLGEETEEELEPASERSTVKIMNATQLRFNNRVFNRVSH